jgi:hypothetical protein
VGNIINENLDRHPYTGERIVKGKVRVKTHEEASWLDGFFDGSEDHSQVTTITRGKVYDAVKVTGYGDMEDVTIINDNGEEEQFGSFFFSDEI